MADAGRKRLRATPNSIAYGAFWMGVFGLFDLKRRAVTSSMPIKPNRDDFAVQTTYLASGAIVALVIYGEGGSCLNGNVCNRP